jgi:hypothetical protein
MKINIHGYKKFLAFLIPIVLGFALQIFGKFDMNIAGFFAGLTAAYLTGDAVIDNIHAKNNITKKD